MSRVGSKGADYVNIVKEIILASLRVMPNTRASEGHREAWHVRVPSTFFYHSDSEPGLITAPLIFLWQKGLMRRSKPSSWRCVDGKVRGDLENPNPPFHHAEINEENPSSSCVGFLVR